MKPKRPPAHLHQGEITVNVHSQTLGELCARRTTRESSKTFYHHQTPPGITTLCVKGSHTTCWKRNCTCPCHLRGGK